MMRIGKADNFVTCLYECRQFLDVFSTPTMYYTDVSLTPMYYTDVSLKWKRSYYLKRVGFRPGLSKCCVFCWFVVWLGEKEISGWKISMLRLSGIWAQGPRESSFCHGSWTFGEIPLSPKTERAIWTKCKGSVHSGTLIFNGGRFDEPGRLRHSSIRACCALTAAAEEIGVSVTSVYNKLNGIEPLISAELVRETAGQMEATIRHLKATLPDWLPGYPRQNTGWQCDRSNWTSFEGTTPDQ